MTIPTPLTPESAMALAQEVHPHSPAWCPTCEAIRDLVLRVDQACFEQTMEAVGSFASSYDGFSCMDDCEFTREHACPGNGCCKKGD